MRRWVLGQGGGSGERNTPHPHPLASGRDGRDGERRAQGGLDTCFLGRLGFLMFVDVREKVESHTPLNAPTCSCGSALRSALL
jgi:hypothetical protein